jgi:hypothetical protein
MDAQHAQELTFGAGRQAVERLGRLDELFPKMPRQPTYAEYIAAASQYAQRNPIFAMQLAEAERQRASLGG